MNVFAFTFRFGTNFVRDCKERKAWRKRLIVAGTAVAKEKIVSGEDSEIP